MALPVENPAELLDGSPSRETCRVSFVEFAFHQNILVDDNILCQLDADARVLSVVVVIFCKLVELADIADFVAVVDQVGDVPPLGVEGLFSGGVLGDKRYRCAGKFAVYEPTPEGIVLAHGYGKFCFDAFDVIVDIGGCVGIVRYEVQRRNLDGGGAGNGSGEFRVFVYADGLPPYGAVGSFALVHAERAGDSPVSELFLGRTEEALVAGVGSVLVFEVENILVRDGNASVGVYVGHVVPFASGVFCNGEGVFRMDDCGGVPIGGMLCRTDESVSIGKGNRGNVVGVDDIQDSPGMRDEPCHGSIAEEFDCAGGLVDG